MSNGLVKKNKKPVYGWMSSEIELLQKKDNHKRKMADMTMKTYHKMKLISLYLLHWKFGYGLKRLQRVEQTVDAYLGAYEKGDLDAHELIFLVKEKMGIDLWEYVRTIPQQERLFISGEKPPKDIKQYKEVVNCVNGIIVVWFALICTALNTQMKMSRPNIRLYLEQNKDYLNSLKRGYLTIKDMEDELFQETKFRFQEQ